MSRHQPMVHFTQTTSPMTEITSFLGGVNWKLMYVDIQEMAMSTNDTKRTVALKRNWLSWFFD